jgi:hypothetical protein
MRFLSLSVEMAAVKGVRRLMLSLNTRRRCRADPSKKSFFPIQEKIHVDYTSNRRSVSNHAIFEEKAMLVRSRRTGRAACSTITPGQARGRVTSPQGGGRAAAAVEPPAAPAPALPPAPRGLPSAPGFALFGSPSAAPTLVPGPSRLRFGVDVDQGSAAAAQLLMALPRTSDLVDQVFTTPVAVRETAARQDGLPSAVLDGSESCQSPCSPVLRS